MSINIDEAVRLVQERFPFEGYVDPSNGAYADVARTVLRYLEPGARILDLGSGPCDKTAVLAALGFECFAYDDLQDYWHKIERNRDKIIGFAREFSIDFQIASDDGPPYESETFDMVMMLGVLEHLHDSPRELLIDLLGTVKPGGYLFVTVPNAVNIRKRVLVLFGKTNYPSFELFYWFPGPWRGHVREYTKDDLRKLAHYLDLVVMELRSCHRILYRRLPKAIRPLYVALTSVAPGWRDSWLLVAKKRRMWAPRRSLSGDEIERMLEGVHSCYRAKRT